MLGLVVTDYLYRTYPDLPEGQLAQVRAAVVNASVLAEVAAELNLGDAVLLGKGEDAVGRSGRSRRSFRTAMEAVIGAVYLDGGWEAAEVLVMELLGARMTEAAAGPGGHDFKTRLQELAARRHEELPNYDVISEGPDHAKRFSATVSIRATVWGEGQGRSKKQAEQAAARMAWRRLSDVGEASEVDGPADVGGADADPADVPDMADADA